MQSIIARAAGFACYWLGCGLTRVAIDWLDDGYSVPPPYLSRKFFDAGGYLEELGDRLRLGVDNG